MTPGPRPWVWLAAGGLLLAGVLLYRAGRAIFKALPDTAQADAGALVKRHARLAAAGGVVLLWTMVYALYSLGLPTVVSSEGTRRASAAAPARGTTTVPLAGAATGDATISGLDGALRPVGDGSNLLSPTGGSGATPAPPPPSPPDCSAAAVGDMVREAQLLAEMLTGRPVGADFGLLVEAVAGCGDAENAVLSLLTPVDGLLDSLGVPDAIDLPGLPPLPAFTLPDAVAAPLRPYVFQTCAEVQAQLVTVASVAPAIHLNYSDLSEAFHQVDTVCRAFAKP